MNNRVKVYIPEYGIEEVKYTFDVLLKEFLGVDFDYIVESNRIDFEIAVGNQSISIKNHFFDTKHDLYAHKKLPQQVYKDEIVIEGQSFPLVSLYGQIGHTIDKEEITLQCDLISTVFFMLSRWEEKIVKDRDNHERFSSNSSIAHKFDFLDRPIVNEITDLLWVLLIKIGYLGKRKKYSYQLVATHDVDRPYFLISKIKALKSIVGRIKNRNIFDASLFSKALLRGKDPFDTHHYMMDESEKQGVLSHFFFMTGGTSKFDNFYSIDHPKIKSLIKDIQKRGHHIGLHPSYNTYKDSAMLLAEKQRLQEVANQEITYGRHHYLRMSMPETLEIWNDIGMEWDSTLSYADCSGFRCGVCYPFPVFSIDKRKRLDLIERPLIVMEGSMVTYEKLSPKEAVVKAIQLKNKVKKHNGEFVFLWHNSAFETLLWKDYKVLFDELYR